MKSRSFISKTVTTLNLEYNKINTRGAKTVITELQHNTVVIVLYFFYLHYVSHG